MALKDTIKNFFRRKKDEDELIQPSAPVAAPIPAPAPQPAPAMKPIDLRATWEAIKSKVGNIDTGVKPSTGLFGIESGLGGDGFVARPTNEETIKVKELFDPKSYKGGNRVAKAAGVTLEDAMNATIPGAGPALTKSAFTLKNLVKEVPKTVALGESVLAGMKYLKEGQLPSAEEVALSAPLIAIAGITPSTESRIARAEDLVSLLKNELKVKSVNMMDEAEAPASIPWKSLTDALKQHTIDSSLFKKLTKGDVVEGDGFVLQKRGAELIATIDNSFKPVVQAAKDVAGKVKTAVEQQPKVVAPEIGWVDPKIFAKSLDRSKYGGKKLLADIPEASYWKAGELDRTQVEAVKSSLLGGDRINPIVLDPDGNVLDGAHRLQALKELGVKDIETVVQKPLVKDPVLAPLPKPMQEPVLSGQTPSVPITDPLLLPQGEIRVPTLADAKRKFKSKGVQLDFVNKLKPVEEPITIPMGGVTGKELYDPGTPVGEPSVTLDRAYMKALDDEYGLIKNKGKAGLEMPSDIIANLPYYKDKSRLMLNDFTPQRNIEDIAGADAPRLKEFFFDRVANDTQNVQNQLARIKQGITDRVTNQLGIKPGSPEDAMVMQYGEGRMSDAELRAATPLADNVIQADKYFRTVYDGLLDQINTEIKRFGYDEIKKRKDYYTHYQELGNLFDALGQVFRNEELPSWLNGLTADFKPGKQFFKFSQPRLGGEFTDSAFGAIDRYLEPALNQIYRTETVQRGRLLERVLSDALQKNTKLDPTHLTNFMAWIRDYTNSLAGKKTLMARGSEGLLGRPVYSVISTIRQKTGANLVGGNIGSALTNFIPFTQALASTEKPAFIKGLVSAVTKPLTEANEYMVDGTQSKFLRNRFDTPKLAPSLWENVANRATWLFQAVDRLVANTVVAGKYFEQVGQGLDPAKAMAVADKYAGQVMADRSFGQMPQIFQNQGLLSLFTQFQLEVNNQIQYLARDVPKESGSLAKTASTLAQVALYGWLYNNMYEAIAGRRPAFDPIDIVVGTVEDLGSNDAPDIKRKEIAKRIMQNIPFVNTLVNGGRIPIGAGIPSISEFEQNPVAASLKPLAIYGAPTGGYQVYKTIRGVGDYLKGYKANASGSIQYPIEQNAVNLIRAVLFGPSSFPEASEYYKEGYSPLGTEQTIILKNLLKVNPELGQQFYERMQLERQTSQEIGRISTLKNQLLIKLGDPNVSEAEKATAIEEFEKASQEIQQGIVESLGSAVPTADLKPVQQAVQSVSLPQSEQGSVPTVDLPALAKTSAPGGKGKKVSVKKIAFKKPKGVKFSVPKRKSQSLATLPSLKIAPPPQTKGVTFSNPRPSGGVIARAPKVSGLRVT